MKLKYNISAYFILPSLQIKMNELEQHNLLQNSYLINHRVGAHLPDCCYLKLSFPDYKSLELAIDVGLRKNQHYWVSYNLDYNEVVYMFSFPKDFIKDIRLIIEGKYSKVSDEYKESFFNLWEADEDGIFPTFYNQVFNKSEELREWQENEYGIDLSEAEEYFSKLDMDKETME